jgi:hypothetical protein
MDTYASYLNTFGYCTDRQTGDYRRRSLRKCDGLANVLDVSIYLPNGALANYGRTAVKIAATIRNGRQIYATFPSNSYLNTDLGGFQTLFVSSMPDFQPRPTYGNPLYPALADPATSDIAPINALQIVTSFTDGRNSNHSNLTVAVYFNGVRIAEGTMCGPTDNYGQYSQNNDDSGWTSDWDQNWDRDLRRHRRTTRDYSDYDNTDYGDNDDYGYGHYDNGNDDDGGTWYNGLGTYHQQGGNHVNISTGFQTNGFSLFSNWHF